MIESPPFPRRRFWASSPSFMGRGGRTISQTTRLQLSMYRKLCPSNVEALGSGERESGIRVNMSRSQSFGWRGGENVNAEKCRKVELTSASVKSVLWGGKPRCPELQYQRLLHLSWLSFTFETRLHCSLIRQKFKLRSLST